MKQTLMLGFLAISSILVAAAVSCTPKGNPVFSTVAATFTPTRTSTTPPTNTSTNTPNGTFTATPTPTNTPSGYAVYNGSFIIGGTLQMFNGGALATTSNAADTSNIYGTNSADWAVAFTGSGTGYAGWNCTQSPASTISGGYTQCTFWAKTSRAYTGAGIEFFGGAGGSCASAANQTKGVTTTYAQYSFALPATLDGSCTVGIPFGIVINDTDVSDLATTGPITVYVGQVSFQ